MVIDRRKSQETWKEKEIVRKIKTTMDGNDVARTIASLHHRSN